MTRHHATVKSTFWNGWTGRRLRALGKDAQLLAGYLMTCPSSNMIGLFYLPLPVVSHEVALTLKEVRAALEALAEEDFAHYDPTSEMVWVTLMALHQIGPLKDKDGRIEAVRKLYAQLPSNPFLEPFFDRYEASLRLTEKRSPKAPSRVPPQGGSKREGLEGGICPPQDPAPAPVPPPVPVPDPDLSSTDLSTEVQPSTMGALAKPHPIRDLLTFWQTQFVAHIGHTPTITPGQDTGILKALLEQHDEATIRAVIGEMFISADPFPQKMGYTIRALRQCFNTLLVEMAKGPAGGRLSAKGEKNLAVARRWAGKKESA